jgi:hypothetical protein
MRPLPESPNHLGPIPGRPRRPEGHLLAQEWAEPAWDPPDPVAVAPYDVVAPDGRLVCRAGQELTPAEVTALHVDAAVLGIDPATLPAPEPIGPVEVRPADSLPRARRRRSP